MSIITTRAQKIDPLASALPSYATGLVNWANPDWNPVFVTSAPTVIAGIAIGNNGPIVTYSQLQLEVEIGHASGDATPVAIGCFGWYGPNSGGGGPANGPTPPYPIGTIPSGRTVSVRPRGNQVTTVQILIRYFENYDGDIADIDTLTLGVLPAAADMVAVTPSGVVDTPSDWVELSPALEVDTDIWGFLVSTPVADLDVRWELGIGAAASETHLTTLPSATRTVNAGRSWFVELIAPYPFLAGTRVVARVRISSTSTSVHRIAALVYRHGVVPTSGQGTIGPLLWITLSFRPPVV